MSGRYDRPLAPEQIAAVKHEDIDFSDIPELDEEFWERAVIVEPDLTDQITMRVKRSVLAYFKAPERRATDADEPRARDATCGTGRGTRSSSCGLGPEAQGGRPGRLQGRLWRPRGGSGTYRL